MSIISDDSLFAPGEIIFKFKSFYFAIANDDGQIRFTHCIVGFKV